MGTRTPNYDLYIPGQGEEAWDDEVGGNFTTIDAALQALADIVEGAVYQINNVTYVAANARWNGSTWNRVNTGAPAVRLMLNSTTGTLEVATAAAGANPITWTTIQVFSATGLDMKSKKIANLATPTAASDAATKAYIDGLIAALKLSQIAIDVDKNWGGKSITNVATLSANALANTIRFTASDSVRLSNSTPIAYTGVGMRAFKIPNSIVPGSTIRVHVNATHNFIVGNPNDDRSLYCSGGPEGTIAVIPAKNTNWTSTGTKDIIVNPGNILSFTMGGWNTGLTLNSVEIKYDYEYNFNPITWV